MIERKKSEKLEQQYELQGKCCYYCEEEVPFSLITRDHLHPRSKGHTFIENKIFACRLCNSLKADKSLEDFQKSMLKKACNLLQAVVNQKFKISEVQLKRLRYYTKVSKKVSEIIDNDNKPSILFT